MLHSLCPFLLLVFLLVGGSVMPVQATDNEILCGEESDCQAIEKVMAAVNENYNKLVEKLDIQTKHLERLSADLLRHDERLKSHVEAHNDSLDVKLDLLGRTATQSSTYVSPVCSSGNGNCVASLAIDGNYNPNFAAGTCATTNAIAGESSWWRVDLGQPFKVQRIMIVNRADCCGERLNNFVVGLSNSSSVPIRGNYAICGYYPGPTANGAHLSLNCNPGTASGRYVIVQQSVNGDGYLTICEIEIYVEQNNHVRKRKNNSGVLASGH